MMKNLLLSIAVAFGFNAPASAADEALNLKMKDGTIHSFILNERPVITMGDGKLYVDTDKTTATYSLYDVNEYAFGEAATGIRGISTTKGVSRNGDNIVFHGVDTKKVVVCNLGGAIVNADVKGNNGYTTVSLTCLPQGVYIIKVSGTSVKINKK